MTYLEHLPHFKILAMVGLLICMALVLRALLRRDRDEASKISFDDLLLDPDGRMSKSAIVMFGSFAMTTWVIIYLTLAGKMTEGYMGLYLTAWVAPAVTKLIKGVPPPEDKA
jgi:hypothetical protein